MTARRVDLARYHIQAASDYATGRSVVCLLLQAMGDLEGVIFGLDPDVAHEIGEALIEQAHTANFYAASTRLSGQLGGEGAHGGGSDRSDDPA